MGIDAPVRKAAEHALTQVSQRPSLEMLLANDLKQEHLQSFMMTLQSEVKSVDGNNIAQVHCPVSGWF